MSINPDHVPTCNNAHGPIGQPGCCCTVISNRELSDLRDAAAALGVIREVVLDVQAKLEAKRCNRWDCLDKAMHIIDVAASITIGKYLR